MNVRVAPNSLKLRILRNYDVSRKLLKNMDIKASTSQSLEMNVFTVMLEK